MFVILKKELKAIVRDKRSFVSLFVPLVIFPLLFYFLGIYAKSTEDQIAKSIPVFCNISDSAEKCDALRQIAALPFEFVESDSIEDDLRAEKIYLALYFENENVSELPIYVDILYNATSTYSTAALAKVTGELENSNMSVLCSKIIELGGDPAIVGNIVSKPKDVSANTLLLMLAPMLITSLLITGGGAFASDAFAGEKERGTLEHIAATQINRSALYFGKTGAVFIMNLFSGIISVLAYIVSVKVSPNTLKALGYDNFEISLSYEAILFLIAVIIVFAIMMASALTLVSLLSKSVKGSTAIISVLSIIPSILGMVVMFLPTAGQTKTIMMIPIYNMLISLKIIFSGALIYESLICTIASMAVYSAVIITVGNIAIRKNSNLI